MKKEIKRLFWGGGVSLISYFSTDTTLGTRYGIYLLCALIADHATLLAILVVTFWAAGCSYLLNPLLHVSLGLPCLYLPTFGITSDGILMTCPTQVQLLRLISAIMDEVGVFRCNSIFEIVLSQNIFKILRRHLF